MDTITKICGNFGIWQLRTILIIFLCKIPSSWFMACVIFTAPEPKENEYYCKNSTNTNEKCFISTDTFSNNNNNHEIFTLYSNSDNRIPCNEFVYSSNFYSVVMQFNLVCDRDIFVAWTQYWHLFGVLLGGIIATKLIIFISPRTVMLIGILSQIICGCLTGIMPDFSLHCAFRCFSAICCALMFTSGQMIFSEITGGFYRIGAITLFDTFWSIGVIFLPTLSSYFSNWRDIYLAISLPTISMIIFYQWIPEAPRWLLKRGKIQDVETILLNAAEINDRKHFLPQNLLEELKQDSDKLQNEPCAEGWWSLWKGPRAKTNFIAAHIALAVYITNFNGMLLNIRSFGRDYLPTNVVITALSEIIGCFLAFYITKKFNKNKWTIAGIFNIIAGLIGCLGWLFPNTLDENYRVSLWMLISSIAKSGVSISQSMLLACLSELVPPTKKADFIFSCIVWARIWLLTAPFINVFKKIDTALSLSFFCILSAVGGIATCCLKIPNEKKKSNRMNNLEGIWNTANDINNTKL